MRVDEIKCIAVIGAGLMGHGIAQELAQAGYRVALNDLSAERLEAARAHIRRNYALLVEAEMAHPHQAEKTLSQISTSVDLEESVAQADVIIEAMAEDLEQKRALFARLDQLCGPSAILASNSSSFMPSQLAVATERPQQVVGAHYFNPPYLVPLVEIIRGEKTADGVVELMHQLFVKVGKKPVIVQREVPGFIGNRIQAAVLREALSLVEKGVATPQDVDQVIRTSIGRRWSVAGVFEVAEIAGLDLKLAIVRQLFPAIESSQRVSELLEDKVKEGDLGVKTGRGFYQWTDETAAAVRERIARALIEIGRWPE